ncbi:MAG: YfhO family protein, partial [Draconibacterium sp.]|nr:YfhO family protein [Draconibacterium sp.]
IGYLTIVIASVLIAFRGKPLKGAILLAIALSLEIYANHLQITYYGFLMIVIYAIVQLIYSIREKELAKYFKAVLYLFIGAIIAVGMNFSRLYTTYEYSKDTVRGGPSELTAGSINNSSSGLDKDYATYWSYGISETFNLMIPNFKGGSSTTNPGIDSESYRALQQRNVPNARQVILGVSMYHGAMVRGTAGPSYLGAIVVFLFVMGLFLVKGKYKWWLLAVTVISIAMAWGRNMMWLTSFLLDYLPMYNKFRAPSMNLVMTQIAVPLLGFIALNEVLSGKVGKKDFLKALKWATIATGGLSLVFAVLPGITGDFSMQGDAQRYPEWLIDSVIADRKSLLRADAFRSFIFIALAAATLYAWHLKKIKTNVFLVLLGLLILVDLWVVDKRYLNNDNFVSKREAANPFPEMPVDKAILQDKDLSYRVLPLQNPFQDARASYYHKNVGGYHAAKLRRYQDIIENSLAFEMQRLISSLQSSGLQTQTFDNLPVINMLNTRYLIYDLNQPPLRNSGALGNAWFVENYKIVENADEEIASMKGFLPQETAIVDKQFAQFVEGKSFTKNTAGSVKLIEYQPNYLKYSYNSATEQLTVFSEIYYDKGWEAYIDGEKVPHFRVNYILRALTVPSGEHTIEFKFEPKSYYTGNKVSLASSILLILIIAGYIFLSVRKKTKEETLIS